MIIFYNKETGKIKGIIEGRTHGEGHLNMWIGDKNLIDRIIISWSKDDSGSYFPTVSEDQMEIFLEIDKKSQKAYEYVVDIETKKLVKK